MRLRLRSVVFEGSEDVHLDLKKVLFFVGRNGLG